MTPVDLPWDQIDDLFDTALEEDRAREDVTTDALVNSELRGEGRIIAREDGVVCGLIVADRLASRLSDSLDFTADVEDGANVKKGEKIGTLSGAVADILRLERTLLNFLQRLSGVASATARHVREVTGTDAVIMDTRKTTPGWRALEKYAVATGGGHNHRLNLADQVLIKENHLRALARENGMGESPGESVPAAIRRSREHAPGITVEIEVEDFDELKAAIRAGADILLLDNMSVEQTARAVEIRDSMAADSHRPLLESSGGIGRENVAHYAKTGVDRISIGALTHSAPALDISLELLF